MTYCLEALAMGYIYSLVLIVLGLYAARKGHDAISAALITFSLYMITTSRRISACFAFRGEND